MPRCMALERSNSLRRIMEFEDQECAARSAASQTWAGATVQCKLRQRHSKQVVGLWQPLPGCPQGASKKRSFPPCVYCTACPALAPPAPGSRARRACKNTAQCPGLEVAVPLKTAAWHGHEATLRYQVLTREICEAQIRLYLGAHRRSLDIRASLIQREGTFVCRVLSAAAWIWPFDTRAKCI